MGAQRSIGITLIASGPLVALSAAAGLGYRWLGDTLTPAWAAWAASLPALLCVAGGLLLLALAGREGSPEPSEKGKGEEQ